MRSKWRYLWEKSARNDPVTEASGLHPHRTQQKGRQMLAGALIRVVCLCRRPRRRLGSAARSRLVQAGNRRGCVLAARPRIVAVPAIVLARLVLARFACARLARPFRGAGTGCVPHPGYGLTDQLLDG